MQDFERVSLGRLQAAAAGIDLTSGEQKTLKWISGWETSTVDNVIHIIEKAKGTDRTVKLTRKDFLQLWGYLQCLKDIYEGKSRDAAQREDTVGDKLTADYMKMCVEITTMQQKINREVGEE